MKTNRGMLALMIVPVLCFGAWAFVTRGSEKQGVYIHSVMFDTVKNPGRTFEPYIKVRIFLDCGGRKPEWWGNDDVHMWPREPKIITPEGRREAGRETGKGAGRYLWAWRKYVVDVDVPIKGMEERKGSSLEVAVDINNQADPFTKTYAYRGLAKKVVVIPDELINNL